MASPTLQFTLPESSLFVFPPRSDPLTLPPPPTGSSLSAPPFSIPPGIFSAVLDVKVPITIACIYAVTVAAINAYNRSRGNKPWPISKTKAFFWFVVAHNVFLAVYSAWTFVGMWQAVSNSFVSWNGPNGLVGTVDSLCKVHGTSGVGNAVTYNPNQSSWVSENPGNVSLNYQGEPDRTDLGRIWNEGLAFYGWFFYLSKFYEVLDTVIILVKGKRSSTLQTYHHAGAMMCMWAGIRFMSPPIWMFCLVNSFIHAMMYTYYTLTAFSVPIPQRIKRSLTTMQIMQFLVGATYASAHSFIRYTVPVQVSDSLPSQIVSSASATATAVASSGLGSLAKKLLLRAADQEGLAENVGAASASPSASLQKSHIGKPTYRTEYQSTPCVDTSGQTFAIWLNVLYLTPLTFLFVRFFIKSYIRRTSKSNKSTTQPTRIEKSSMDALKGIDRELNENDNAGNGVLKEKANGHAKQNGHVKANGNMNGGARKPGKENGSADINGSIGKAVVKDPLLKGGDAIMKTS